MTVVVGVDGSRGSGAAIRLAAREARYRSAPLLAVMAYSGESTLGAPATRPVAMLRTAADEQIIVEEALRDVVRDALGDQAGEVEYRVVAGIGGPWSRPPAPPTPSSSSCPLAARAGCPGYPVQ